MRQPLPPRDDNSGSATVDYYSKQSSGRNQDFYESGNLTKTVERKDEWVSHSSASDSYNSTSQAGSKTEDWTNDWSETVTEYGVSATNKGNWADNEGDGNSSYSSSDSGGGFHHNAYYLHYEQYRPGQNVPRPTKPQTDYPTLPGTSQGPSWADIAYHHLTHNPDVVFGLFTSPVYLVLTNSQVQDALVDTAIWAYNNPSEAGHLFLDAVGLVPGLGEAADAINSIWYSLEGDTTNAALSLAAVAPFAGWAATGGKVMSKLPLPSMAEATGKILNKVDDAVETATKRTGAAILNPNNIDDWDRAEEIYELIRRSSTDIDEIAKNSGIRRNSVERVKNHLFYNEHLLDDGIVGRFDAHPEIANAWERLRTGTATAADRQLFKHELAESIFEQLFGGTYRRAHEIVSKRFPSGLE